MSDAEKKGFDALLEEIGGMAKAMPGDSDKAVDDKVAAAAAEGDETEEDDGEDENEPMGKSFKLTLDDGSEVDAVDGTALVKSLVERVEGNETKTLEAVTALVGLVKSLQGEVTKLASSGKGRKAVLTVTEKPAPKAEELKKSEGNDGISGEEFMAKAMSAQVAGKIGSRQVSIAEQYINAGQNPPADIIRAVLG